MSKGDRRVRMLTSPLVALCVCCATLLLPTFALSADIGWESEEDVKLQLGRNREEVYAKCIEEAGLRKQRWATMSDEARRGELHRRNHFVPIRGGKFQLGSPTPVFPFDGEGSRRRVDISPFHAQTFEVSALEFCLFQLATNYTTTAEHALSSPVPDYFLPALVKDTSFAVSGLEWWKAVRGATWFSPEGLYSSILCPLCRDDSCVSTSASIATCPAAVVSGGGEEGKGGSRLSHPAVHVSMRDAQAYCEYIGGRLPTEAEFEWMARGGKGKGSFRDYPWGDEEPTQAPYRANIWTGDFPHSNSALDGCEGACPTRSFLRYANAFGLANVIGNVWEWTQDDWTVRRDKRPAPSMFAQALKVKKGGSFLCHPDYCKRYRISARSPLSVESSSYNVGFRCVRGAGEGGSKVCLSCSSPSSSPSSPPSTSSPPTAPAGGGTSPPPPPDARTTPTSNVGGGKEEGDEKRAERGHGMAEEEL
eukprot:CAMPEP_0113880056 /NCGR_PEP_ID=MMETSP0780_2-20120614/7575_1 /TAXON_ID=652834 /ORGANISM="Palpitomonas bilix" /LENGTH=476 /DNA_ID=CAMNT_0000866693 /DNA_START=81 /DNA_END=1511 /DNA_ORIENTATION=+ /assembly_acc=CAM_ASM_000599